MLTSATAHALVRESVTPYAPRLRVVCGATAPRAAVLVVSGSFALVARLQRSLGAAFELLPRSTVTEAGRELASRRIAALLLEAEDARGVPTAALAANALAAGAPAAGTLAPGARSMPVVAIVRRAEGWTASTLALIEARPSAVVVAEDLDIGCVVRALSARVGRAVMMDDVWPTVARVLPAGLWPLARLGLEREGAPLSVPDAARALGVHRKTLWIQCRRQGVESAQVLLMWCRVIAAAWALRTRASSVDAIAQDLEFASPTALRNAIRRYLGVTATEVRLQGGEVLACRALEAWLARGVRSGQDARTEHGVPRVTAGDVA